jgi:cAMP-dependent protein kinase regulator
MELSRDDVQAVIAQHPGVGAALDRFYKQRMMLNVLRGSPIFRALSDTTHDELLTASVLRTADKGELLVKQGAASGGLWLILRGRCEVASRTADGTIIGYPDMREGDVFGEISLALDAPATATVVAAAPSVLFMLPADAFNRVVRPNPQAAAALKGLGEVRLRRMGIDTALDLGA